MHRTDMRWSKHTATHIHAHSLWFFSISFSLSVQFSLKEEQYLTMNCSSFCYLARWGQPAGVREIETDMRADSVYHISPQSDRKVPDLSACLFYSLFHNNLKWQQLKSTVIYVEWDHIKHSLVSKGRQDRSYTVPDTCKIQILSWDFLSVCTVLHFILKWYMVSPCSNVIY